MTRYQLAPGGRALKPGLLFRYWAWHTRRQIRRYRLAQAAKRAYDLAALAHAHIPVEMTDHHTPVKPAQSPDDDRQHNHNDDHDQNPDQPMRNPAHHGGKLPREGTVTP